MSMFFISTQTVSSPVTSVTFSSIPSSVSGVAIRDLIFVVSPVTTAESAWNMRINNDLTNNYAFVNMIGTSTAAQNNAGSGSAWTVSPTSTASTTTRGTTSTIIHLFDFTSTTKQKSSLVRSNRTDASATQGTVAFAGRYFGTLNAVTSVTFALNNSQSWASGATFTMYGVAA